MMYRKFFWICLPALCGCLVTGAQSLQGFYTGEMKVPGLRERISLQLELMESSDKFKAVFRSRIVEEGRLTGCDNWLEGTRQQKAVVLKNLTVIKETEVPQGTCVQLDELRMMPAEKGGTIELTGTWRDKDEVVFGKFTLQRVDTALSFSVADEAEIAMRNMSEIKIFQATNDSTRIALMLQYRTQLTSDTVMAAVGSYELKIAAPRADPFHKLTVLVNDDVVLLNHSPRTQQARIKLDQLPAGDIFIRFLCYHAYVNVWYPLEVTLTGNGIEQSWTLPVSTDQHNGLLLRITP